MFTMKGLVIVLLVVNLLLFGLSQGLFGVVRSDVGRNPGLAQNQLNSEDLTVLEARLQKP